MAGILGEEEQPPPPNQGVLDQIAAVRAAHESGGGWGPFAGNEYFEAAAQPGMSGYFQVGQGGNIIPQMFSMQDVAAQAGLDSAGQLGQGFFPSGGYGAVGYNIPNDLGGFFGAPISGVPTTGAGLSTNNWRLLGRGPGWIMRQGNFINTQDPNTPFGLPLGVDASFSDTAEAGAPGLKRFIAPGAAFRGYNKYGAHFWPGGSFTGYSSWPYATAV